MAAPGTMDWHSSGWFRKEIGKRQTKQATSFSASCFKATGENLAWATAALLKKTHARVASKIQIWQKNGIQAKKGKKNRRKSSLKIEFE